MSQLETLRAENGELRVALALARDALARPALDRVFLPGRGALTLGELIARALAPGAAREATAPRAKRARKRQMPRVCRDGHPELAY